MNELQKKLMRRRNLNGEMNGAVAEIASGESSVGDDLSLPQVQKKESQRPQSQDINTSRSSSNELFNKLARRRDLNGEIPKANNESSNIVGGESSMINNSPCTDQISDVPSLENETCADKTSSRTISVEKPLSDNAPAWLNDLIESTTVAEACTDDDTALQNNNETNQSIDQNQDSESGFLSVVAVPVVLPEITSELLPVQDAPVVVTNPLVVLHETTIPVPVPTEICDSEQLETHNPLITEHIVPESANEESISPEIPEDCTTKTDQSLHAQDSETQLQSTVSIHCDEPLPLADIDISTTSLQGISPASPLIEGGDSLEQESESSAALPVAPMAAAAETEVLTASQPTADPAVPTPMTLDMPVDCKPPPEPVRSSSSGISPKELPPPPSLSPSRSSWSPLRFTSSSSASSSTNPPLRANTNTGAEGNTNSTNTSPLRRSSSLSGSHTAPSKKSSWYPGKYILEGSTGWNNGSSSKNNTPRLKMNSDTARSHYAELLSSSAKEYPEEHLAAVTATSAGTIGTGTTSTTLGSNNRVLSNDRGTPRSSASLSQQQREEEIKVAQIPETAVRGTSDDIIDIVLQLSRENSQLKKEVTFLKEELTRQLNIVASLQPKGEVNELAPDTYKTSEMDINNTVQVIHMEEIKTAPRPGLQKSRSSSRRFGARGYYSNYSNTTTAHTGEEEEDEDLFDPEQGSDGDGETAKRPVYHTSDFAIEDLVSTPTVRPAINTQNHINNTTSGNSNINNTTTTMYESSQQNLDLLLNSVHSNSASKEKERLSVRAEKYLVQSFMSTSMTPGQESQEEQLHHSNSHTGVWKEKFGSLGLLSETQQGNDALFGEERESLIALESAAAEAARETMDYQEFLSKFTKTHELVNMTRDFIFSILGPNGDATQPTGRKKLNYIFYGVHKLDLRCRHFFDDTSNLFLQWSEFAHENEERLLCARDGIEQYVMTRIAEYAFKTVLDSEGDDILLRRMKLLSFLKPESLDIKPDMFNETLLAIAAEELRKINSYKTPGDKVACVVKSVTLIFRSLSLCKATTALTPTTTTTTGAAEEESNVSFAGADDFMPLFIWVVLRSHIPKLASNVSYIQAYLNPARLMGKWGYCLINLCSAIEFVKYAEPDQFIIDAKEYDMKLAQAERELNVLLLEKVFGADDSGYIPPRYINQLMKLSWSGYIPADGIRALCWRVLLGLISPSDKSLWESQLSDMIVEYNNIKAKVMPSLDKVEIDPLSAMSSGNAAHEEWSLYYKNVDLITFIKTDLERLYITGIPDEYFESKDRRDMLLGILVIWSFHHPVISYRQGMHEMTAYVMYVIETELRFWSVLSTENAEGKVRSDPYGLLHVLTEQNIEANTYHIFARIMNELEPIYDPVAFTPRGAESQPFVVQFSTKVQEHYLRMLDSELCEHLEECHVSAQIYGMRWSRLLLGREFTAANSVLFKLWDFLFACCYEAETVSADALLDIDSRPNINSLLASVRIAGHNQHSNEERRNITSMGTVKHVSPNESSAPDAPQYVCTPLLGALGDLMLAMMLNIREQLLESDSSSVLGYLMHYPDMLSATPILDYADMIKRGVIMGPEKKPTYGLSTRKAHVPLRVNHTTSNNNSSSGANVWNLQGMKQRVAEKFNQVTLAMGSGLSEIVNNLADLSDDPDGSPQPPSLTGSSIGAHPGRDSPPVLRIVGGGSSATKHTSMHPTENTFTSVSKQPDHPSNNNSTLSETETPKLVALKSDSTNPTTVDSDPSVVAVEIVESDPLSGVLEPPATTQLPTKSSVVPAPSSPVLTGKGTGYKNMPSDAVRPPQDERERDSLSQSHFPAAADGGILNSPSITGYHLRKKIFTHGWLSSSKKDGRPGKRDNRSSGGVDLHVLHSSLKAAAESGSEEENSGSEEERESEGVVAVSGELRTISKPKRSEAVLKIAVGDRLLDLADSLVNPPYANLPATLTVGRELEYENLARRETVKRLRAMADVLAGLASLESYDARFGQDTSNQVDKGSIMSPVRQRTTPPTTMSPLPPVREEGGGRDRAAVASQLGEASQQELDDDDSEPEPEAQLIKEVETSVGLLQHQLNDNTNTTEAPTDHIYSDNHSIQKDSIVVLKN